jgi:hypothetical protein
MYSAFENKEEDTVPVTTTSLTDTQPVATTTTAPTTTQLPRSSLDILQSAGVQATRPAAEILKGAGVTSAKDVLRSMYFEKPEGVLEAEGITAASILEDYRKEQAGFKQRQDIAGIAQKAEADLRKKEEEFIKNYRYDLPQQTANTYQTSFGSLNIDPQKISLRSSKVGTFLSPNNIADSFAYTLRGITTTDPKTKQTLTTRYVFLPAEHVMKGMDGAEAKKLNTGFLEQKTWEELYKYAQPIDLSELGQLKSFNGDSVPNRNLTQGYIFKEDDYRKFYRDNLETKFFDSYNYDSSHANTPILGIANYNGELVYVRDNLQSGRTTYYNTRVGKDGVVNAQYFTAPKDRGGVSGVFQDIGEFVAEVPFLPEIAALIAPPGTQAYVYASLKALQTSGAGGSPSDVLKSAAVAFVTASVGQELGTYGDSLGASIQAATGVPAAVATTMGNAVVNAGFNGFVAAATGQDVGDAMLTGAISGGLKANSADITNAVFGGADNVAALSKTLNLSVKQTQAIFTGALASGSINSVVKNESFMDAFTESLIVQGVSQSGANAVANNLKGTLNPKALQAVQSNTRIFLQATARAAVRGEDIETAIARVAPYLQGRAIGQTVNILTSKKD